MAAYRLRSFSESESWNIRIECSISGLYVMAGRPLRGLDRPGYGYTTRKANREVIELAVLKYRVKASELDPCIRRRETPPDLDAPLVPLLFPGGHLPLQLLPGLDPPGQALPGQHRQLDLRHVQPAPVLRRVVDLQLLGDPPGLLRRERLVERGQLVRVQVVHHQHHLLGLLVHP